MWQRTIIEVILPGLLGIMIGTLFRLVAGAPVNKWVVVAASFALSLLLSQLFPRLVPDALHSDIGAFIFSFNLPFVLFTQLKYLKWT